MHKDRTKEHGIHKHIDITVAAVYSSCYTRIWQPLANPSNQVMEASPSHLTAARKPIMNVQYSFNIKTGFRLKMPEARKPAKGITCQRVLRVPGGIRHMPPLTT